MVLADLEKLSLNLLTDLTTNWCSKAKQKRNLGDLYQVCKLLIDSCVFGPIFLIIISYKNSKCLSK